MAADARYPTWNGNGSSVGAVIPGWVPSDNNNNGLGSSFNGLSNLPDMSNGGPPNSNAAAGNNNQTLLSGLATGHILGGTAQSST
jgi:hypothetical protein